MKSESGPVKIFFKKVKDFLWFLGLHAFSVILFFLLTGLILGVLIFYKYAFLAENKNPKTSGSVLKFNEKLYQEIIKKSQYNN